LDPWTFLYTSLLMKRMNTPKVSRFVLVLSCVTLAGGAYILAAPQVLGQRVPQAQVPQITVPTIGSRAPGDPPQAPAGTPMQLPVMSAELARAYMEAAERHLDYLPGRVLVKFKDSADVAGQTRALSAIGHDPSASDVERSGDLFIVKDSSGADPHALAERLSREPEVEYAEPDYLQHVHSTPNDPSYGARQWNLQQLNFPRAWDIVAGGDSNVIVAVVDTGVTSFATQNVTVQTWSGSAIVSYTMPVGPSPDFTLSRFVSPRDFTISTTAPPAIVMDTEGHGTHVAGTIGENTNNGVAFAGIAYNVRIMPLKACQSFWDLQFAISAAGIAGSPPLDFSNCANSATNAAIRFAADNGARVINYSIGGTGPNQVIRDAMAYAISKGVFIAMSNGNEFEDGNPTTYPAAYGPELNGAMSVAATSRTDARAFYSSTGSWTEISAPGGDSRQGNQIWQASIFEPDSNQFLLFFPRFDRYAEAFKQGTSMASPHVAGLAALLVSQMPNLTPAQIEFIIRTTAKDLGAAGRDNSFGYGLIQPRAALFGQGIR
jgi:serine protease